MQQEPQAIQERSALDPKDQWDLTRMYKSDAAWEEAFAELDAKATVLPTYEGKLNDAQTIHDFLDAETALIRYLSNLYCYASLRRSEDTRADVAQSMYSRIMAKYVQIGAELSFAEPELLALPEAQLTAIVADPALADYRFSLQDMLRRKAHTLTAAEEKLMAGMGEIASAPSEIADNLQDADMVFSDVQNEAGESITLTGANYIVLQSSSDRVLRKNAFDAFYTGYRQHINTFAATYSGAVKAAVFEARTRRYPSSREMSMAGENIPVSVYDNLVATVREHLPAMYRYVALRKKIMGIDELH